MGKEAGLYIPSGTMSNLIAVCVWCEVRGSEFIVGSQSHIHLYEQGGVSSLGGVHPRTIPNQPDGTLSIDDMLHCIRADDIHFATMKLVALETTQNKQGGLVLSQEYIAAVGELCKEHGLALHIDGARICNAAAYLGVSLSDLAAPADSVSVCLSKGLGAPVGSVLVGPHAFIAKARRLRKALGGGMRQAGVLAAAGLVALRDILPKLGEDHTKMRALAAALAAVPGVGLRDGPPPTNICFFTLDAKIDFTALQKGLRARGIAINGADGLFRLVMHHQVLAEAVPGIAAAFAELVAPMMSK